MFAQLRLRLCSKPAKGHRVNTAGPAHTLPEVSGASLGCCCVGNRKHVLSGCVSQYLFCGETEKPKQPALPQAVCT